MLIHLQLETLPKSWPIIYSFSTILSKTEEVHGLISIYERTKNKNKMIYET